MIVRFDDTNPSKEKEEFEESIKSDLLTLGVVIDRVTHTSDYFDLMQTYAEQMINDGEAVAMKLVMIVMMRSIM
jgi:glutamyl-tRNA synthetase